MFSNKRTGGAASGKNKQAKHTGPAAARAGKSVDVQDGKSRFFQKPPAALLCTPLIVVYTTLAILAYWRLAPGVSESAKRFVDVQQCMPGELLPPPSLPSSVSLHMTSEVGQTVRAAKIAWLFESNRADATGEEISDERLKQIYLSGKKSFLRHAANSEMKTYTNDTQKRSFDLQRAAGIQQPVVPGMTPQQVRNKVRHEQEKNAPRHQPAFPAAINHPAVCVSDQEWEQRLSSVLDATVDASLVPRLPQLDVSPEQESEFQDMAHALPSPPSDVCVLGSPYARCLSF
mmetsp:Transcript_4480/g.10167  ORF Transcript_4480/g.10167 Transcript_4480/m.10167 type:complete len:288 (-) Transcript_4480:379-1242(-)